MIEKEEIQLSPIHKWDDFYVENPKDFPRTKWVQQGCRIQGGLPEINHSFVDQQWTTGNWN